MNKLCELFDKAMSATAFGRWLSGKKVILGGIGFVATNILHQSGTIDVETMVQANECLTYWSGVAWAHKGAKAGKVGK